MTRDILANIETRRSSVTDKQIKYFADAFDVEAGEIFQQKDPSERKV
jgi:hypothetical protein